MRWPWKRRHTSAAELQKSKERLADARRRWPQVHRAVADMDHHREVNGFAELIRRAMGA